ncbi:MAG: hypothetical protein N4A71_18020 [Carboxylicivirga sp.]|jgi:hypothetical protein|nr:hypothetical protein [Carboxylicivirga sp.]
MNNAIIVPAQLERIDEMEESLRANCQEEEKPVKTKSILQKLTIPFVFLTIGLMGVVYISSNKILVGIAGLVLTVVLIWSFINIQRNKNIDKRTRRSSYWTILVLLSIIGITISKVFGPFFE